MTVHRLFAFYLFIFVCPSPGVHSVPTQGNGLFLFISPGSRIADESFFSEAALQSVSLALCPNCKSMRKPRQQVPFPPLCEVMEVREYWLS